MISLHKVGGQDVIVNAELIETLEPGPQTVIHMTTGNKVIVREKIEEVVAKVIEYKRSLRREVPAQMPAK